MDDRKNQITNKGGLSDRKAIIITLRLKTPPLDKSNMTLSGDNGIATR